MMLVVSVSVCACVCVCVCVCVSVCDVECSLRCWLGRCRFKDRTEKTRWRWFSSQLQLLHTSSFSCLLFTSICLVITLWQCNSCTFGRREIDVSVGVCPCVTEQSLACLSSSVLKLSHCCGLCSSEIQQIDSVCPLFSVVLLSYNCSTGLLSLLYLH